MTTAEKLKDKIGNNNAYLRAEVVGAGRRRRDGAAADTSIGRLGLKKGGTMQQLIKAATHMNKIVTTTCYRDGCGGTMEGRKGEYTYVESGLDSVVLKDILVFHCTKCNAIVPEVPAAGVLHRVIALRLLMKKTLLTGRELRFLRKLCGYSVNEFSEIVGSRKQVVSRWENYNMHGKGTDRTVRLLVLGKLVREIAGQPDPILHNVTVEQLNNEVLTAFKTIVARDGNEQYEIGPEEIARYTTPQSAEIESADLVSVM